LAHLDLSRSDIRRELDLEAESRSLGQTRYERSRPLPWREEGRSVEEEANLPPGQQLLRLTVTPTAEAVRQFVVDANEGKAGRRHSAVKWLELAAPEEVAYLTARVVLNLSTHLVGLQSMATAVARAIIDHVDMTTFKGKNPNGYYGFLKKSRFARASERRLLRVREMLASEESRTMIPPAEKLHLGMAAIELLVEATGLFEIDTRPAQRGHAYYIRPTEATSRWLMEQHSRSALLQPMYMPMVVRPRRWRNLRIGGYLIPTRGRINLVKSSDAGYIDLLGSTDLTPVYEALNHIQETPWRINRKVLEVMREAWDGGGNLAALPPRDDRPLPPRPDDIDTNEEARREWRREAALTHEHNSQLFSQRMTMQQRLWIADKFVDEPAIWFPHTLDFRGRVYPMGSTGLHPQADDPGKALLEFAHGLPLGKAGAYWLAIHVANVFGVDKVSFEDRIKWTYDHAEQLIDSALNPLDGARFWTTADSPWMALAATFEFASFLQHGDTYVSHLPIPLDGSNSGLQHFSALLRDPTGAEAVNLVPSDVPSDVYGEVAARAQAAVDSDPDPRADAWRHGKVSRKIAKQPTMTYVYSATRYGVQDMILQRLRELDAEGEPYLGGADNYEAANYLSYVLFDAIAEVVSAATKAMTWLRKVAKVASNAGVPLTWWTPDGFPVRQDYRIPHGQRLIVHWRGRRIDLMLVVDSKDPDVRGQANGVAPNYVHSLDAAHLRALARAAKKAGIDHLGVVHDSFATHAARTDELSRLLRETFVEQYRPDLLRQFRDEIEAAVPEEWKDQIPQPPKFGSLDLEAVRHSPYLFA
jgi:DNA-directed RNA polymerase